MMPILDIWGMEPYQCVCKCLAFVISYDPMDCSLPGSSVPGVSQARILAWVAVCFSMGSSQPRDRTHISYIAGGFFTTELPKFPIVMKGYYYLTVFILLDLWYINFEPSLKYPNFSKPWEFLPLQ